MAEMQPSQETQRPNSLLVHPIMVHPIMVRPNLDLDHLNLARLVRLNLARPALNLARPSLDRFRKWLFATRSDDT